MPYFGSASEPFDEWYEVLRVWAQRVCENKVDPDEIVNEVFESLAKNSKSTPDHFVPHAEGTSAYLGTCARNAFRKLNRRARLVEEPGEIEADDPVLGDETATLLSRLDGIERTPCVDCAARRLDWCQYAAEAHKALRCAIQGQFDDLPGRAAASADPRKAEAASKRADRANVVFGALLLPTGTDAARWKKASRTPCLAHLVVQVCMRLSNGRIDSSGTRAALAWAANRWRVVADDAFGTGKKYNPTSAKGRRCRAEQRRLERMLGEPDHTEDDEETDDH